MLVNKKNKQVRTLPKLQYKKPILCATNMMKLQQDKFQGPQQIYQQLKCGQYQIDDPNRFKNKNLFLKPKSRINVIALLNKSKIKCSNYKQVGPKRPSMITTQCQTVLQLKRQKQASYMLNDQNIQMSKIQEQSKKRKQRKGIFTILRKQNYQNRQLLENIQIRV